MRCSNCGAALRMGERFCGECGTPRPELPAQFAEIEEQYLRLKKLHKDGQIEQAAYEQALQDLVIQDESGQYWMIGDESEEWHRFDGQDWQRTDPPQAGERPMPDSPPALIRAEAASVPKPPIAAASPARKKPSASR